MENPLTAAGDFGVLTGFLKDLSTMGGFLMDRLKVLRSPRSSPLRFFSSWPARTKQSNQIRRVLPTCP